MRGTDILKAIQWAEGTDTDTIAKVEAAILELDREVYGTNRPVIGPARLHLVLRAFIKERDSAAAAAKELGISRSFLCDIENSRRSAPPSVLKKLGYEPLKQPVRYAEI
jgi:hypothetical protein